MVEPRGITLAVREGESIMAAAQRCGYHWPTLCHGDGTCSICWVEVKSGADNISAMKDNERETLTLLSERLTATRTVRLACQARVLEGEVTVRKPGVRPAEDVGAEGR
ncbi:2Fe-2S iron-sulfur cluster-binding protein [Mycobacterium sp. CVI_P3]|uniref:2Fe-2S iron-sulfur cluster-binding protein n=1 Tax=Mycobacterium pinniadriaticum TaxID=2994102 RepID=A0ABT3SDT5_9MYCO|nr:2Fe-2S iron-sulfur cluster-binding protein [Mycobacterium pinniadriaticum]MCX2930860.1 2Fe-2S iron-sulfur cluster-binding protein [Mycobacterium pinniadriaticum]MCX2937284.1 2Fe-2S iron-sulfur cluster-binding protein [Mycobacterium pinniadriaticum]